MTPDDDAVVRFDLVDDHIAMVTIDRPHVRNAVNGAVARGLEAAVKRVEQDDGIRVAVLASSLASVFCAGADLGEISRGNAHLLSTADGGFAGITRAARRKPWIAAVRGAALAGGCEIALACDMIVASDDARFGLPEVARGLIAGAGGIHRLPRALPRNIALEMIASGQPILAPDARAYGMVNRVVPSADVLETAISLARVIAGNAPLSVTESLSVARRAADLADAELWEIAAESFDRVMAAEDAKEGPRAFLEKRPAVWSGR